MAVILKLPTASILAGVLGALTGRVVGIIVAHEINRVGRADRVGEPVQIIVLPVGDHAWGAAVRKRNVIHQR